jgi:hypothetical protein
MMTLEAKWPKMVLEEEVEALFEKIVLRYGKQHSRALLRKVHNKLIERYKKEGKLIVV